MDRDPIEAGMSGTAFGLVLAVGVPLLVFLWAVCWPAPEPRRK